MHKKIISFFLCLGVLLVLLLPVSAQETQEDLHITTREEFLIFAQNCRLDSYSRGLTVSLDADIALEGAEITPIPIFCGTFLGNDHRISGIKITAKGSEMGLFRYLTETAVVRDLTVSGEIQPQGSRASIGGIAGENAGLIENCVFSGTLSGGDRVGGIVGRNTVSGMVENCQAEGGITGNHFVGGIAGENAGVIRACENRAKINTTAQQNSVDISDITIETITGTEAANTVTDIGGIAGTSTGTVRGCANRGDIGYKHMGYNIGGITGSQSGYLVDCENFGAVSGRKEVGGIVGHMEPSILLRYETDTVQLLKAEIAVLKDLTDRAALNAKENTAKTQSLVTQIENHIANGEAALNVLTIDPENPQIQDADTYHAAFQTLGSSISGIDTATRSLYQAIKDTGTDLETDLQAVAQRVAAVEEILNGAEENLGGTVADISDADTAEDLTSKLENSTNYGQVLGDLNVGGVVGAMALENDLDPESDVSIYGELSLNAVGSVRSVVLNAVNSGAVTAKKNNAGGIVGWQSLGLVKDCVNTGDPAGEDYVGGISGQSLGYIRACYTKSRVTGDVYVGGIAGSGTVLSDCRAMTHISGSERLGGILGYREENRTDVQPPLANNLFVSDQKTVGAVDGIDYDTAAQKVELDVFLALTDVPEQFKTTEVTFLFEDGTKEVISLTAGSLLTEADIPQIPEKAGAAGLWSGLTGVQQDPVYFDLCFRQIYTADTPVLCSEETREDRPVLLVQGDFTADAAVRLTEPADTPTLSRKETLLECRQFTVQGSRQLTQARYLVPAAADPERLQVYVRSSDGVWQRRNYTLEGSYVAVSLESGDNGIALTQSRCSLALWLLIGAAVVVVTAGLITAIVIHRKRKPAAPVQPEENTKE